VRIAKTFYLVWVIYQELPSKAGPCSGNSEEVDLILVTFG
jgi:hypothetical protein